MDKIKPLLRKLNENLDRAAIVVFLLLTASVILLQQNEKANPPGVPLEPPLPTEMTAHLPSGNYNVVVSSFSWNDQIFQRRPLNEEHPFFEIIADNMFTEREPPDEQTIRERIASQLADAHAHFEAARSTDDIHRIKEELEATVRLCNQIINVWVRQTGGAEQGDARELLDEAQAALDAVNAALDSEATP